MALLTATHICLERLLSLLSGKSFHTLLYGGWEKRQPSVHSLALDLGKLSGVSSSLLGGGRRKGEETGVSLELLTWIECVGK